MDRAEVVVSNGIGDAQVDFIETEVKSEMDSIPSIEVPKIPDAPARIKIKIPAGLYDLYW
jgi:hypothetical protein